MLLGYLNGTVVPYSRSQSMVKEQSAEYQRPCSGAARHKSVVATWDTMRQCLQQLMENMGPGEHSLPLSNIKRLFRAQFHVELSETALGYAKLSECLQDSRLHDLCEVKLKGHGYGIVPVKKSGQKSLISLSDSLCVDPAPAAAAPPLFGGVQPGSFDGAAQANQLCVDVRLDGIPETSYTSPKHAHQGCSMESPQPRMLAFDVEASPVRSPFPPTPSPGPKEATSATRPTRRTSFAMMALAPSPVSVTPSPDARAAPRSPPSWAKEGTKSMSRLLGNMRSKPQETKESVPAWSSTAVVEKSASVIPSVPPGSFFLPQAPGPVVASSSSRTPMKLKVAQTPTKDQGDFCEPQQEHPWCAFTPTSPGTFGFSVHNTFLHAPMPLHTPVRDGAGGARVRTQSVPLNAGRIIYE